MPTMVERNLNFAGKLLNWELEEVLEQLSNVYGPALEFLQHPSNDEGPEEYINFQVRGLSDDFLFSDLELRKFEIFGLNAHKFQILRATNNLSDRGVFLRHLNTPAEREEFVAGFWHY